MGLHRRPQPGHQLQPRERRPDISFGTYPLGRDERELAERITQGGRTALDDLLGRKRLAAEVPAELEAPNVEFQPSPIDPRVITAFENAPELVAAPPREPYPFYPAVASGDSAMPAELAAALTQMESTGDAEGQANVLNHWGFSLERHAAFAQALQQHRAALELFRATKNVQGVGDALNDLALVHARRGQLDLATELHARALEVRGEVGDELGRGRTLNNLAIICIRRGEFEKARSLCDAAITAARKMEDVKGEGKAAHNLGVISFALDDIKTARARTDEGKEIRLHPDVLDFRGAAKSYNNLGVLDLATGAPDDALVAFDSALWLAEKVGDRLALINALNNLVLTYETQADHEASLPARSRLRLLTKDAAAHDVSRAADVEAFGLPMAADYLLQRADGVLPDPISLLSSASTTPKNPLAP